MSPRKTNEESAVSHPRETAELFGHREAEAALLEQVPCPGCGAPTTSEVCAFCKLVERAHAR